MRPESPASGRLLGLFAEAGAQRLDLPVLHPADPFLETAGEDVRRRMFVTEGPRGERLALRPDFTIPVCLHHLAAAAGPARYCYEGLVFRRHDRGSPERLETGYEDIGHSDRTGADAEALALAIAAVKAMAGTSIGVRVGDIGLFASLLSALGLPEPWRRRLRRSFGLHDLMAANLDRLAAPREPARGHLEPALSEAADRHDRGAVVTLLAESLREQGYAEGAGRTAAEIADRFLDQRALAETRLDSATIAVLRRFLGLRSDLRDAAERVTRFGREAGLDLGESLDTFAARNEAVASLSNGSPIAFEASFGRPLDYYTGVVFEIVAAGEQRPRAGGGRYDRLMEMLGAPSPVPAIGFAIRLDEPDGAGS
ncbi:ATP phosphoribosyltransferase regulatory subunit [Faunimonas sp. B44]|uniref:ATP phosphoribosyltransferase regulatory subunit n=1 Tax=Faunimonas sp. B44 TaxID=3461493 RepID=UPI004044D16A